MKQPQRRPGAARHGNWGMRGTAVLGSVVALAAFWQLAAHNPHPNISTQVAPTATPADNFTIPTGGNPLALPTPPNSGTGLSH